MRAGMTSDYILRKWLLTWNGPNNPLAPLNFSHLDSLAVVSSGHDHPASAFPLRKHAAFIP
ncbi:protein of unknown function [Candidatus Methylomirabilis oxygeniifera]|uniref:Uncharacterized protein n=1 Tax=Methylomirabilis oxygeniifera TaxID=671143 RepID=D5MHH7_METO1|nr:protein of unknown function [Candidatus Methylomirabilis oxyfera]